CRLLFCPRMLYFPRRLPAPVAGGSPGGKSWPVCGRCAWVLESLETCGFLADTWQLLGDLGGQRQKHKLCPSLAKSSNICRAGHIDEVAKAGIVPPSPLQSPR